MGDCMVIQLPGQSDDGMLAGLPLLRLLLHTRHRVTRERWAYLALFNSARLRST